MKIKYAFLDLDSVAYIGACIAQKTRYKWVNSDTDEESEVFKCAKDAKVWMEGETFFGSITEQNQWQRQSIVETLPEQDALHLTVKELANWVAATKRLTDNPDIILKGYLTKSGLKTKDIPGLERRYQQNRYADIENWIPSPKPTHLTACRNHLLNLYGWIKLAPDGFEADAVVITLAEKKGKEAVIVSKDKDLRQAMGTYLIDMNPDAKFLKLEYLDPFGEIVLDKGKSHTKLVGSGFKFLCAQAVMGDPSDGYLSLKKFGAVSAYNLLVDCATYEECLEALVRLYNERFPEGYTYTSWDKQTITVTANKLLVQHFQLAYQERGISDMSNPIKRYLEGLPIFYEKTNN